MSPVLRTAPLPLTSVALASALLLAFAWGAAWIVPQVRQAPSSLAMPTAAQTPAAGSEAARNGLSQRRRLAAGPEWSALTSAQQKILQPLQQRWPYISEVQKRHWIVLAASFDALPAQEQLKLRDRMESWASLSAQQRSQARLNYAITKRLTREDKWAQWEAYQALSDEEKKALAAKAVAAKPAGVAPALRPVPAKKLVRVPAATTAPTNLPNPPKIPTPPAPTPQLLPPASPSTVPAQSATVETRPVHTPSVVETAPVNLSTATPMPLPALATDDATAPAGPSAP